MNQQTKKNAIQLSFICLLLACEGSLKLTLSGGPWCGNLGSGTPKLGWHFSLAKPAVNNSAFNRGGAVGSRGAGVGQLHQSSLGLTSTYESYGRRNLNIVPPCGSLHGRNPWPCGLLNGYLMDLLATAGTASRASGPELPPRPTFTHPIKSSDG